ncbi:hypothetical protein ACQ4PT_019838 [Festuca glaucescens]
MEELAMAPLTKVTRNFLADQQRERTISSLHLKLYLTNTFFSEVGPLVGDAIDNGLLKDLDLTVLDETDPLDRSDEDILQRAQEIDTFFRAYPSVLHCLTKLSLKNAGFDKLEMHHVLFDCCKQLKHLSLCYCDTGTYSVFKIDAPNSKLCVLEIDKCRFKRLELVCLPKLEKFACTTWGQSEEEDWLSMLTDDVLLSILRRVDLETAVRTSVISTRWRHLPWLLPQLTIDVDDFLSVPFPHPIEANDMDEAMVSLTKVTRSFLADHHRESTISSLNLALYLINTFLCEIGSLVGDAIESGLLKDLDLTVLDVTKPVDRSDEERPQRAQEIYTFFSTYPSVLRCLTKLSIYNADFNNLDMHHVLFDCCKQLKHLSLCHCDTGTHSAFIIDAPNSRICVLETDKCRFERIDLVCLPKLEKFVCFTWES